jgi:hypothetical protein
VWIRRRELAEDLVAPHGSPVLREPKQEALVGGQRISVRITGNNGGRT